MQPVAYLRVFQLADIAIDMQDEVVKIVRYLVDVQVFIQARLLNDFPNLLAEHRQFLRVHPLCAGVLVHKLLAARDVTVAVGSRHRGN